MLLRKTGEQNVPPRTAPVLNHARNADSLRFDNRHAGIVDGEKIDLVSGQSISLLFQRIDQGAAQDGGLSALRSGPADQTDRHREIQLQFRLSRRQRDGKPARLSIAHRSAH